MKIRSRFLVILLTLLPASVAMAQEDGETLVTSKMCYACHQLDSVSLGPPWRAIAARHGARRDVMVDVLAGKIIRGGGGNWGLVPMVPNQRVSEEEARIMAEWILARAP
jgi:cytochrome c